MTLIDARTAARALFAWWRGAMLGLLPDRLRPQAAAELVARLEGGTLRLERRSGGSRTPAEPAAGRPVVLLADDARLLRQRLRLPAAAGTHLRAVAGHELERTMPLKADQAWFDARLLGPAPDPREIEVEIAALPRAAVAGPLDALRRLGLVPVAVELSGASDTVRLPLREGGAPPPRRPAVRRPLLVLAALLLLGLGPLAAAAVRQLALEAERRGLAAEAGALHATLDRLEARRGELDAVAARRQAAASALVVVEALSRLLPDGTWLTELRFDGSGVELVGRSADAAALLPLVESSPHFDEAAFRAALTREGGLPERFEIGARVVPHDRP
jgi:general secretion pathway protein L